MNLQFSIVRVIIEEEQNNAKTLDNIFSNDYDIHYQYIRKEGLKCFYY